MFLYYAFSHSFNKHIFYTVDLRYPVEYDSVLAFKKIRSVMVSKNKPLFMREMCRRGIPNSLFRKKWVEALGQLQREGDGRAKSRRMTKSWLRG